MSKISLIQKINIIVFFLIQFSFPQSNLIWQNRTSGDCLKSVEQTNDSGYYAVGSNGYPNSYTWLVKCDKNGDELWTKSYGSTGYDCGISIVKTANDEYVILSEEYSGDAFRLLKTDGNGDTLWTKTYKTNSTTYHQSILQTSDFGFLILINPQSLLIKTDSIGDTLWTKSIAGEGWDRKLLRSMAKSNNHQYVFVGEIYDDLNDSSVVYLLSIDSLGNTIWEKTYSQSQVDIAECIQKTNDGNFIVAGITGYVEYFETSDIWLLKINTSGDTLWTKTIDIGESDALQHIIQADDGGFLVFGWSGDLYGENSKRLLLKINISGDIVWQEIIDDNKFISDIKSIGENKYVMVGYEASNGWIGLFYDSSTGIVEKDEAQISRFDLYQNYPNPFNPSTVISYHIPYKTNIEVNLYNVLGQKIKTLYSGINNAGKYEIKLSAAELSSGIYYYELKSNNYRTIKKCSLIK